MSYQPLQLNYYQYLKTLWRIADHSQHCINTEFMALTITSRYLSKTHFYYCKELAYVTTVMAAKICEDGGGFQSINNIPRKYHQMNLYDLEKDIFVKIQFDVYDNHFVNQIDHLLTFFNVKKKLSESFVILLRYLVWCRIDLNTNILTIILALKLNKNKELNDMMTVVKYYKPYTVFDYISLMTEFEIKDLILEYNKIKRQYI
jgi:hypothetical protein